MDTSNFFTSCTWWHKTKKGLSEERQKAIGPCQTSYSQLVCTFHQRCCALSNYPETFRVHCRAKCEYTSGCVVSCTVARTAKCQGWIFLELIILVPVCHNCMLQDGDVLLQIGMSPDGKLNPAVCRGNDQFLEASSSMTQQCFLFCKQLFGLVLHRLLFGFLSVMCIGLRCCETCTRTLRLWMANRPTDHLTRWPTTGNWFTNLTNRLINQTTDWLIKWQTDRQTDRHTHTHTHTHTLSENAILWRRVRGKIIFCCSKSGTRQFSYEAVSFP